MSAGRTFYPPGYKKNGPKSHLSLQARRGDEMKKTMSAPQKMYMLSTAGMPPVAAPQSGSTLVVSGAVGRIDRDGRLRAQMGQTHSPGEIDRIRVQAVEAAKNKILAAEEEKKRPGKRKKFRPTGLLSAAGAFLRSQFSCCVKSQAWQLLNPVSTAIAEALVSEWPLSGGGAWSMALCLFVLISVCVMFLFVLRSCVPLPTACVQ